jgi:hypothetical protein
LASSLDCSRIGPREVSAARETNAWSTGEMIKTQTLFIIGAGASVPYGFPTGGKLLSDAKSRRTPALSSGRVWSFPGGPLVDGSAAGRLTSKFGSRDPYNAVQWLGAR